MRSKWNKAKITETMYDCCVVCFSSQIEVLIIEPTICQSVTYSELHTASCYFQYFPIHVYPPSTSSVPGNVTWDRSLEGEVWGGGLYLLCPCTLSRSSVSCNLTQDRSSRGGVLIRCIYLLHKISSMLLYTGSSRRGIIITLIYHPPFHKICPHLTVHMTCYLKWGVLNTPYTSSVSCNFPQDRS